MNSTRNMLTTFCVGDESFVRLFYAKMPATPALHSLLDLPDFSIPVIDAESGRHEHILVYAEKGDEDMAHFAPAIIGPRQAEIMANHLDDSGFKALIDANALHPSQQQFDRRHPQMGFGMADWAKNPLVQQDVREAWFMAVGGQIYSNIARKFLPTHHGRISEFTQLSLNDNGELTSVATRQGEAGVIFYIEQPKALHAISSFSLGVEMTTKNYKRLTRGDAHVAQFSYAGVDIEAHIHHDVAPLIPQLISEEDLKAELTGLFVQAVQDFSNQIQRFR